MTGEVAEWSNALDLKSSFPQGNVGSNPTLSVLHYRSYSFPRNIRVHQEKLFVIKGTPIKCTKADLFYLPVQVCLGF